MTTANALTQIYPDTLNLELISEAWIPGLTRNGVAG
jgi:hypothetical protein